MTTCVPGCSSAIVNFCNEVQGAIKANKWITHGLYFADSEVWRAMLCMANLATAKS